MASPSILHHALLGPIKGLCSTLDLIQFKGLPYATIQTRFARSILRSDLPALKRSGDGVYDARQSGPSSVQPMGAAKLDAGGLQLPIDEIGEKEGDDQSEFDCLNLTVVVPRSAVESMNKKEPAPKLPVVLFLHGGAFFMGAGSRSYYTPLNFCTQALENKTPFIFVSANYRLGALGFLHSPQSKGLIPPNNGLHDQLRLFEWIRKNISGFGGDERNITAIGQSAGAESLTLHQSLSLHAREPPFQRSITFSGSPMCMPAKTPEEHHEVFLQQAQKLGIERLEEKSGEEIAKEVIDLDVDKIRGLNWVGIPCTRSEMMPYDTPSMALLRGDKKVDDDKMERWVGQQIVSASDYDGGISFNMIQSNEERKNHSEAFIGIAKDVLNVHAQELLEIYGITPRTPDDEALLAICQFETDIGFFSPALAEAIGSIPTATKTYLQLWQLGNPFPGPLKEEEYATHTWDICALLGAFDRRMSPEYKRVVQGYRRRIFAYISRGEDPCAPYTLKERGKLIVDRDGVRTEGEYKGEERLKRLDRLAVKIDKVDGRDILWNDCCRRFLMQGK